jgi:glycerol uptake facilitator-like aquaporin
MNLSVPRLGAEALGTLFFVFLGGNVVLTAGDNLAIALGWALALAVSVWIFSAGGAHLNPWVTIGLALRTVLTWVAAAPIIVAQLVGGFLGALLTWWLFSSSIGDPAAAAAATRTAAEGEQLFGAIAAEALLTLALLLVVFTLIGRGWYYGLGYGLAYGLGVLAIGALTGASMNFARTFGAELSATFAGVDDWGNIWVYLVGPAIGVVLAWVLAPIVSGPLDVAPERRRPGDRATA